MPSQNSWKIEIFEIFDPGGDLPFACPFVVRLCPLCSPLCIASQTAPQGQSNNQMFSVRQGLIFFHSFEETASPAKPAKPKKNFPPSDEAERGNVFFGRL